MLTKIILENFKVFKERTEIDLTKTNYAFLPQNVADNGVLKGAVFVGANASGKSSVLEAIKILLKLLFDDRRHNMDFYVSCIPSNEGIMPNSTSLQYDFLIGQKKISYQFQFASSGLIDYEYLYLDDQLLLKRERDMAVSKIADPDGVHYDDEDIADDVLFLRTLYFNTKFQGQEELQEWMEFLARSIYIHQIDRDSSFYRDPAEGDLYLYLEHKGTEEFNHFFNKHHFDHTIKLESTYSKKSSFGKSTKRELYFTRAVNSIVSYSLAESFESTGNQSLIRLLHAFFIALSRPCMLIIDEFSSGLHNDLEELLIKYFMKKSARTQLFLVTHSTNLLDNTILRPDQEYAVEFVAGRGGQVRRFSSEQPRLAQNVEKMYLSGVFGGIPDYKHEGADED